MLLLETERICKEVKRIGRDEYESCYVFFFIADYETQTELAVSTDINGE